ncbi:peroxisomal assembly protein [Coemansia sp. Benny D115]|nr:peroxisomal assembly protein [Coemansia sp. Benny D115]
MCQASEWAWLAISPSSAAQTDDLEPASVDVSLEPIEPVELTEVVFGVDPSQYDAAVAAKKQIAARIHAETQFYYAGHTTTIPDIGEDNSGVFLRCLMCQPVSQGIIRGGKSSSASRIILVKTHGDSLGPDNYSPDTPLVESGTGSIDIAMDDDWDIGAEWLIMGSTAPTVGHKSVELSATVFHFSPDHSKLVPAVDMSDDLDNIGYMSLESLAKKGIVISGTGKVPQDIPQIPLETARKVTLARVSSPLSEQRDMETHALAALQQWLSSKTPADVNNGNQHAITSPLRVVKLGDLIAVRISLAEATVRTSIALMAGADTASRLRNGDPNVDPSSIDVNPVTDITLEMPVEHRPTRGSIASSANDLVFYKVVDLEGFKRERAAYGLQPIIEAEGYAEDEYESVASESEDEDSESDDGYEHVGKDVVSQATSLDRSWAHWYAQVRDKGFVVRSDVTVVMQTGSVHERVPYRIMQDYLQGNTAPSLPASPMPPSVAEIPYAHELDQLLRLANASLHPLAITRKLTCSALLKGNPGTGKRHLVHTASKKLGIHLYELSCYDILADSEDKTAQILQVYFNNAARYTPCILHLRSIEALAQASGAANGQENADDLPISRVLKKCIDDVCRPHQETGYPIVVVASSNQPDKVPASLAAAFRYEIDLGVPDERTRLVILKSLVKNSIPLASDADLAYVAQQTASFVARDLETLIRRAENHAWRRARGDISTTLAKSPEASGCPLQTRDLVLSGQTITNDDLLGALGDARASMSDTLGVPKIPNVKWDDVGGLADAKKDILDTIRLPMEQPHLFASGLSTRSGLLFYGPPGTGKTLLAKAIATECGLNFFSCKGPELISPYIGESEANVRRIFQKAREASPCVIFFDELDSLAPKRGQQGDSGGVMDRIVSQLLAELDGMSGGDSKGDDDDEDGSEASGDKSHKKSSTGSKGASGPAVQVFAIGATNRPDLLDPALLRPGRFDKLVYLGVSETHDAQLNIIQALTRKFHLHPDLDLRSVADQCPFHYTGADFYALCSDALLKAMLRTVDQVDALVRQWNEDDTREPNEEHPVPMTPQYYLDQIAEDNVKQVTVTQQDFEKALDELIPSVSADELVRYQELRRQFDSVLKGKEKDKGKSAAENSEPTTVPGIDHAYAGALLSGGSSRVDEAVQYLASTHIPIESIPSSGTAAAAAATDTATESSGTGSSSSSKRKNKGKGKGKEPAQN